jgi:hypothetical protein
MHAESKACTRAYVPLAPRDTSITYSYDTNAIHPARSWSKNRVRPEGWWSSRKSICALFGVILVVQMAYLGMHSRVRTGEGALPEKDRGLYLVDPRSKG